MHLKAAAFILIEMNNDPSFVSVKNLRVSYEAPAKPFLKWLGHAPSAYSVLKNVSFRLAHGDHVTLYGTSGAGKSTLLRALTGLIKPSEGSITVNNRKPQLNKDVAAGYISTEESENNPDSVYTILHSLGLTHNLPNLPALVHQTIENVGLEMVQHRPAFALSTTERLRLNIARAAMSHAPLILFDEAADQFGADQITNLLKTSLLNRTVIIATRQAAIAEALDLPILLLHAGTLAQSGTRDEIAMAVAAPRTLDIWVEGLRYDLFRKLKQKTGVTAVQLLPSTQFSGQRLRITLASSRHLPSLYDALTEAPLIEVQELPPSLHDIIARL